MPPNGFRFSSLLTYTVVFIVAFWGLYVVCLRPQGPADVVRHPSPGTQTPPQYDTDRKYRASQSKDLKLKHVFHHGAGQKGPRARRLDISSQHARQASVDGGFGPFPIKTRPLTIDKPVLYDSSLEAPICTLFMAEDVTGPDVEDKDTVVQFAYMSEDAYKPDPSDPEWYDLDKQYNNSIPFGWADSGIRGHVFSDDTNSTIVLSIKGTTVEMFEGNGTSGHDKENDNLFGSCCCGQGGTFLWRQVCDCQTGTYTCDDTCVKKELKQPNRYYEAILELYDEVIQLYPKADIVTTGHSLGGVLASLIGLRHSIPSVSFEAYPQALAAARLGLPVAGEMSPLRKNTGGFHFGHTGDPVYMGTCNSASSFCSIAGFAFETICHTGKRCVYDVVKDLGWGQSTRYHRLRFSIEEVYKKYDKAAPCEDEDVDCVDCYLWKFENGTRTTTSSSSIATSTTFTRTETCKTPGWWGCRDETTTTATSTTETTTTTSTCETPGWFGCKDKTTTDSTTSTTDATTTTCTTKGWFGRCLDETSPTPTPTPAAEVYAYWRTEPTATATVTPV